MEKTQEKIRENIRKICKTDEDKLLFIETAMGLAGHQTLFIHEECLLHVNIPQDIHYVMSLTAANMISLQHGKPLEIKIKDYSNLDWPEREKLLDVIKYLIEQYADECGFEVKNKC